MLDALIEVLFQEKTPSQRFRNFTENESQKSAEITDEDIENIAKSSSDKVYSVEFVSQNPLLVSFIFLIGSSPLRVQHVINVGRRPLTRKPSADLVCAVEAGVP
jgi:hypothetical protein